MQVPRAYSSSSATSVLQRFGQPLAARPVFSPAVRRGDHDEGGRIARQLVVSITIVEANLTKIYAKLGVRSRTALARLNLK